MLFRSFQSKEGYLLNKATIPMLPTLMRIPGRRTGVYQQSKRHNFVDEYSLLERWDDIKWSRLSPTGLNIYIKFS